MLEVGNHNPSDLVPVAHELRAIGHVSIGSQSSQLLGIGGQMHYLDKGKLGRASAGSILHSGWSTLG